MPFVVVQKGGMGSRIQPEEIRMGWHLANKEKKSRTIYFSISRDIIERLKWEIKTSEDATSVFTRASLLEGTLDEAGFLMLAENWDVYGYRIGTNKGNALNTAFAFGVTMSKIKHYVINDDMIEVDTHPIEYSIDDEAHTILIQCPDWLRYNPLSVRTEEVEAAHKTILPAASIAAKEEKQEKESIKLNRQARRHVASVLARTLTK